MTSQPKSGILRKLSGQSFVQSGIALSRRTLNGVRSFAFRHPPPFAFAQRNIKLAPLPRVWTNAQRTTLGIHRTNPPVSWQICHTAGLARRNIVSLYSGSSLLWFARSCGESWASVATQHESVLAAIVDVTIGRLYC